MIKLFRKIRQNLLAEGKIGKYLKYAIGEIILVVLGILIALQLNNLNDVRKTTNLRQVYYNQILQDFEEEKVYIENQTLYIDSTIMKFKAYKEIYNDADLPIIDIISKYAQIDPNLYNTQFKTNTITTLQNTGDIKLIPPIIRKKLVLLDKYQKETENISKYNNDEAAKAFTLAGFKYGSREFFFENTQNQPKLRGWVLQEQNLIEILVILEFALDRVMQSDQGSLKRYKKVLADMGEIEVLINKELQKSTN